MAGPFLFGYQF
jgi:hypothetical protein